MDTDAVQKIEQRLAELPQEVQAAVHAADLGARIRTLGTKHQLHIDQLQELEDEVMLAMLGFAPLESLGARLATALRVPPAAGEQLAAEISQEIFLPIRESLKRFTAQKAAVPAPAAPAPAAAPAAQAAPAAPAAPKPATAPMPPIVADLHKADVMLTQKTVSLPPAAAPAPAPAAAPAYSADPYREPV